MSEKPDIEQKERLEKRVFFLAIPLFFIFSLILGLAGYTSIAIFFGSVLMIFFIYRLDIIRNVFGINIERWNLWFGIECACGFFYFAHLNLIRNFYVRDFLSTFGNLLFEMTLVFSIVFIIFREVYLAPKQLREYFEKNPTDIKRQKKIQKQLRKQELGILALSCIVAFGLGRVIEIAVIVASIIFLYKILKIELKNRRFKSSTEKFFKTHANQLDSFWVNFIKLPGKFLIAFVLVIFVCFINIPALGWGRWASQDVILSPLLIAAVSILVAGIKYRPNSEKPVRLVSLILILIIALNIIIGNPTLFPFIRGATEDLNIAADVQYFLLFWFVWPICVSLLFLNDIKQKERRIKKDSKNKKRFLIKLLSYLAITLVLLVLLLYAYRRVEIGQIKVLLLTCISLLLTLPFINKIKSKFLY